MTGMIAVALAGGVSRRRFSLRATIVAGCLVASLAVAALAAAPSIGAAFPLRAVVFMLGLATGSFAVGAIASMMMLAGEGRESREGLRMGLWGAAQAIAFAIGGFSGTVAVDVVRWAVGAPVLAYSAVFAAEAVVFVVSATLALAAVHRVPSAPAASAT
jgi:BCD family chlorophyll transporter-like MFS transporter